MKDYSAGYTILIVESPTLAERLQKMVPEQVVVRATKGFLWKPRFNESTGRLGKKADPGSLPIRKILRSEAAHAARLIIATDSDPSGDFIAWSIYDDLNRESVQRGNLQSLDIKGAEMLLETAESTDFSMLHKRLENRFKIWHCWNQCFPEISMKKAGLAAIFSTNIPVRTFSTKKGELFSATREVLSIPLVDQLEIHRSSETAWQIHHPLSTFGAVTGIARAHDRANYSAAQRILQELFETVNPETDEGLISYPRTEHRSFFPETWESLQNQWILGRDLNEFMPEFLRKKTSAEAAHDALRPIDIRVSPEWITRHIPKKPASAYRVIYNAALESLKMPKLASHVYSSHDQNLFFIPRKQTGHQTVSVTPVLTPAELGKSLCTLGVIRPSGFGPFLDHAVKTSLIDITSNMVVRPGKELTEAMTSGADFMKKLKQLKSIADHKSLNYETVRDLLSS